MEKEVWRRPWKADKEEKVVEKVIMAMYKCNI